MSPETSGPSGAEFRAPTTPASTEVVGNPNLDKALDATFGKMGSTPEDAAVRPEGYPVVTNPNELAARQARTDSAIREQRVADGKAPFVMPQ